MANVHSECSHTQSHSLDNNNIINFLVHTSIRPVQCSTPRFLILSFFLFNSCCVSQIGIWTNDNNASFSMLTRFFWKSHKHDKPQVSFAAAAGLFSYYYIFSRSNISFLFKIFLPSRYIKMIHLSFSLESVRVFHSWLFSLKLPNNSFNSDLSIHNCCQTHKKLFWNGWVVEPVR